MRCSADLRSRPNSWLNSGVWSTIPAGVPALLPLRQLPDLGLEGAGLQADLGVDGDGLCEVGHGGIGLAGRVEEVGEVVVEDRYTGGEIATRDPVNALDA